MKSFHELLAIESAKSHIRHLRDTRSTTYAAYPIPKYPEGRILLRLWCSFIYFLSPYSLLHVAYIFSVPPTKIYIPKFDSFIHPIYLQGLAFPRGRASFQTLRGFF